MKQEPIQAGVRGRSPPEKGVRVKGSTIYKCTMYSTYQAARGRFILERVGLQLHTHSHTCGYENCQIAKISAQMPKKKPIKSLSGLVQSCCPLSALENEEGLICGFH
jgi:hypothetical protein